MDIDDIEKRCTDIINKEMVKFTAPNQEVVAKFCLEICLTKRLHTLFTESELLNVTDQVFSTIIIRDFVLDLTDKFSVKLGEYEIEAYIANKIAHYPSRSSVLDSETLMPLRILDNIAVYEDDIVKILINNKWLLTIVFINLYFFNSDFFDKEEVQANTKETKKGLMK